MNSTHIRQLLKDPSAYLEKDLLISGWIRTSRDSKTFGFIELNDGTCFKNFQIVFDDTLPNFEEVLKLTIGSSIAVTGALVASQGSGQAYELKAKEITIIGFADHSNPIQKKRHTLEYLREIAHLRPRTNTFMATFRVRSVIAQAVHEFFAGRGFTYVHTPIITSTDAEGAGEMFTLTSQHIGKAKMLPDGTPDMSAELFGKPTYLTVSGQLNVEPFCFGFRDVYTFGPTFRAENSNTTRHACEFWMIEPEIAFADLNDDIELAEAFVKYIINAALEKCPDEMAFFNQFVDTGLLDRLQNVVSSSFEKITYTKAVEILQASGHTFDFPPVWGDSLQTEHERYLTDEVFHKPVFVTNYPKEVKAFYMRLNDDGKTVRATDLLVPGIGEIIGGSQREERMDVLLSRMEEVGINPEEYSWYLDTRRFGTFQHAGFGLGFERAVMYITGMKNIRDVIPYPRTPNTAEY